jgi:hypothetical protein
LAGADRYLTAAAVAHRIATSTTTNQSVMFEATGTDFADALAASNAAAQLHAAVLLTNGAQQRPATADALRDGRGQRPGGQRGGPSHHRLSHAPIRF